MAFNVSTKNLYFILLFLFFFVVTISMVTTSLTSRIIVEQARTLSIILLAFGLFISLFIIKFSNQNIFSSMFIVTFFSYGSLLSLTYGGIVSSSATLIAITIIFMGTYLLSSPNIKSSQYRVAKWFIAYAIIVLLITYITDGLVFSPVPNFIFEYSSMIFGTSVTYAQGTSQFYGYSALSAASLIVVQDNRVKRNALTLLMFLFILLSLLGGARGDSVFALLIALSYLIYRSGFKQNLKLLIVIIIILIGLSNTVDFNDILVFQRLESLSGGFGSREILFSQSIELLYDNAGCIMHGCGFGFFQSYFGYDIGLYPHNFIVELIIVFGLPLTVIMLVICIKGFFVFFKEYGRVDIIGLFFIYTFFLGLKSGSLITSWLLIVFFIHFISFYISDKWNKNYF